MKSSSCKSAQLAISSPEWFKARCAEGLCAINVVMEHRSRNEILAACFRRFCPAGIANIEKAELDQELTAHVLAGTCPKKMKV